MTLLLHPPFFFLDKYRRLFLEPSSLRRRRHAVKWYGGMSLWGSWRKHSVHMLNICNVSYKSYVKDLRDVTPPKDGLAVRHSEGTKCSSLICFFSKTINVASHVTTLSLLFYYTLKLAEEEYCDINSYSTFSHMRRLLKFVRSFKQFWSCFLSSGTKLNIISSDSKTSNLVWSLRDWNKHDEFATFFHEADRKLAICPRVELKIKCRTCFLKYPIRDDPLLPVITVWFYPFRLLHSAHAVTFRLFGFTSQVQLLHGELGRAEEASVQVQEAAPVGTQGRQQLQRAAAQEARGGLHSTAARPWVSNTFTSGYPGASRESHFNVPYFFRPPTAVSIWRFTRPNWTSCCLWWKTWRGTLAW